MHLMSSILRDQAEQNQGTSTSTPTLSVATIWRHRKKNRVETGKASVEDACRDSVLTVHWDGKLLPTLSGRGKEDRLPVVISGVDVERILAVPNLPSATGEMQAEAVYQVLESSTLAGSVKAMSFDTTASNTGKSNGACTLLEKKIGRELLNLACRHHILEIMIGKVFEVLMGRSSGPEILLFKRFRENWEQIDQSR